MWGPNKHTISSSCRPKWLTILISQLASVQYELLSFLLSQPTSRALNDQRLVRLNDTGPGRIAIRGSSLGGRLAVRGVVVVLQMLKVVQIRARRGRAGRMLPHVHRMMSGRWLVVVLAQHHLMHLVRRIAGVVLALQVVIGT